MSLMETVKEVEKKLMEAGEKLLQPPASVEELLTLLDLAENTLGKVEQSPGKSMHDALSSLRKALVSDELLGHTDADVKASVASCISEVTRITAPDAPYDDDKMKKVFQLIVSSFEDLSDESSRSYKKRAVILETLAKVRSCVIMLDLECDDLITDMFQTFFRTIRDYHPSSIYTSMETIMNLVLEESEEVSTDLLTTLLSSVKRENEEVPPIARRLGESILGTCAVKLKPYLTQAIKYSGISLDNYSKIVTSVCEGTVGEDASNALIQQPSDGCKAAAVSIEVTQEGDGCKAAAASSEATQEGDGSKAATASSKETQVDVKDVKRNSLGDKSPAPRLSLKITMSNGTNLTSIEKTSGKVESSQKGETSENDNKSINDEAILKPESRSSGVEKSTLSASKSRKTTKNRRKRASSSKKSESSEPSHVDGEKEAKVLSDNLDSHEKDVDSSLDKDVSPKVKNVESDKETADIEALKDAKTASPSTSPGKACESLPERDGHQQEKECATQGDVSSTERVTEKESERPSDSGEASGESPVKVPQESPLRDETSVEIGTSKQDSGTSDSEDTPVKKPSKKSDLSDNDDDDDDSPLKRIEDSIKRARTKARSAKATSKSSTKKDLKVMSSHNRTAKSSKVEENEGEILSKRKRSLGKGEASGPVKYGKNEPLKYGKNLIRSKVKVWWPIDNEFYKGVIVSYDPDKRKHLVVYDDGDEELLNLRKEKWQLIGDDSVIVTDDDAEPASIDASSEMYTPPFFS
ncbi:hypothetical protein Leryth_008550 [Lithospermum erythrorhizon]|nr:hypothetical protein Leryth_008550 [Lithospermum erythrorhizon]